MQNCFGTLFLLLSLFVLSASRAWACGNDNSEQAEKLYEGSSKQSCCSEAETQTPCEGDSEHQHSDSECPCDHESNGCHCSGCGMVCHSVAAFPLETPLALVANVLNFFVQNGAFYFAEHLPEAVYLPIWQPPKIGA